MTAKVELKDICHFLNGGTPSKKRVEFFNGNIPWISSADIDDDSVTQPRNFITKDAVQESSTNLIPKGTVMLVTRTGVGKVAIAPFDLCFSQDITAVVPKDTSHVLPEYVAFFLRSKAAEIKSQQRGATIQGVTRDVLVKLKLPIPSLERQKTIIDHLSRSKLLIQKRQQTICELDNYLFAFFFEMFGDPISNSKNWPIMRLDEIADIGSGITKGKKYGSKQLVEVPYIRVANVQAGFLNLTEIKTIKVADEEVNRYLLKTGDVLMTEGGDWDKLGRGAVWDNSISPCIHQNHIFRVRCDTQEILPHYLDLILQTNYAKGFFQKAAKQTTNLATINKTQLSAFPVPIPLLDRQQVFCKKREQIRRIKLKLEQSKIELEKFFISALNESFQ